MPVSVSVSVRATLTARSALSPRRQRLTLTVKVLRLRLLRRRRVMALPPMLVLLRLSPVWPTLVPLSIRVSVHHRAERDAAPCAREREATHQRQRRQACRWLLLAELVEGCCAGGEREAGEASAKRPDWQCEKSRPIAAGPLPWLSQRQ